MSTAAPRPLAEMRATADRLVAELAPFCERIEIAGSIRRQRPQCADVELVAIPKLGTFRRLGELLPRQGVDLLDHHVRNLIDAPHRTWHPRLDKNGRPALGERYKRLLVDGIALDLFRVLPPASFAVIYLIRTGGADFARSMVTQRSKGGRLPDGYRVQDGQIRTATGAAEIASEEDWFALANMPFVPPEERG